MEQNNKFNKVTGFFPNKSGKGMSVGVTEDIAAALAGIGVGDRLFLNGLDTERPFISYAKADPAYQAAKNTTTADLSGTAANRPAPKKPARVEKF